MLKRDLVVVLERPELERLHLPRAEEVENRLLGLGVDNPLAVALLGDAHLTAVERCDRLFDGHRTPFRISAARAHCASLGTNASRT